MKARKIVEGDLDTHGPFGREGMFNARKGADTIAQAQSMGSGAPEAPNDADQQSFIISIRQYLNGAGSRLEAVQQNLSSAIDVGFDYPGQTLSAKRALALVSQAEGLLMSAKAEIESMEFAR